jgi:hypothetical protein
MYVPTANALAQNCIQFVVRHIYIEGTALQTETKFDMSMLITGC